MKKIDADKVNWDKYHSKECGSCTYWMKCTCPREKWKLKPSCNSMPCEQFEMASCCTKENQELLEAGQ